MELVKKYEGARLTASNLDSLGKIEKFITHRPDSKVLSRRPYRNGIVEFTVSIPYKIKKELEEFCKKEDIGFYKTLRNIKEYVDTDIMGD